VNEAHCRERGKFTIRGGQAAALASEQMPTHEAGMTEVSLTAALLAGIISFLSPCVLPLVPPYLAFIAGTTFDQLGAREPVKKVMRREIIAALLFVLGFSTVFVALGATASALGGLLRAWSYWLTIIAGVAIIAMGLHFLDVYRLAFLYRSARVQPNRAVGLWGAYVMGLAFAFGWTPCIGPVLAAILAVAASEQTVAKGAGLLAVYSLGLGIPFLIAAFALDAFTGFFARMKNKLGLVEKIMGAFLVLTGIAFLTGWITSVAFWLLELFPVLAKFG
jgi:cytochrome c-type biogenesis protein